MKTYELFKGPGYVVLQPEYAEISILVTSSYYIKVIKKMATQSTNMPFFFYSVVWHTKGKLRPAPNVFAA